MSDIKKSIINAILGILSLLSVACLWKSQVILIIALMTISLLMIVVRTEKRSIVVFFIGFICGTIAESIGVNQGAWSYVNPVIFGKVPIWLPFLWANASLFLVNTEKLSHILFKKQK